MKSVDSAVMSASTQKRQSPDILKDYNLPTRWLEAGTAILDEHGIIQEINLHWADWFGQSPANLQGTSLINALSVRFPEWRGVLENLLQSSDSFVSRQIPGTSQHQTQWFQFEITALGDSRVVRMSAVLPPLLELQESAWDQYLRHEGARRELFVRLLTAEGRLQNLMTRWPGVIFSQRPDLTFSFVSDRIELLTGITADQWEQSPGLFWRIIHEADTEQLQHDLKRSSPADRHICSTFRLRHAHTGRVSYILEQREAVYSDNGLLLGYEGFWLDVSRQTIAEKRLSTAAWKETLAVLAMGLAHDFSNILAGIHSLSETFQAQVDPSHPFQEGLALIKRNAIQASQLVHRILSLNRGKPGERNYHNLNDLVRETIDLMRKVIPRQVQIEVETCSASLPVYADAVELRQVLINLTLNAVDAMPQGGKLSLTTAQHREQPQLGHYQGTLPRLPSVSFSVRDTGCGIPARHLSAIFDPFFTTKAINKGSGLGLYNARLFVEKHQGAISVESEENAGSAFSIWLPQADFTESERLQAQFGSRRHTLLALGPAGKTLDRMVDYLREQGFYVVAAASETNACELLYAPDYHFTGLVLMAHDQDCSYRKLLRETQAQHPPLKIIVHALGCNRDEIESELLNRADLILASDMPGLDILGRIKTVLEGAVPNEL